MGPKWTGTKAEHAVKSDWQWEVDPYMLEAGFKAVMYEKGRKLREDGRSSRTGATPAASL